MPIDISYLLSYTFISMKYFDWNEEKNRKLKEERHVCFEEVRGIIESGGLLDIILNPNQKRYPQQKMFIIDVNHYAYVEPFVEEEEKVFLKTIFPSRSYTKKYLLEVL